jgi:hypothetical protein
MPVPRTGPLSAPSLLAAAALVLAIPVAGLALVGQGRGAGTPGVQGRGQGAPAGRGARAASPVDLTGYWVSIVTEDWIERMSPDSPPSGVGRGGRGVFPGGDAAAAPQAAAGATPDPCRAYAAGGSLRVPGRLNITWADDNTLKIEMDAGSQTRLLRFNPTAPPTAERSLQGYSVASWEIGRGGGRFGGPAAQPTWGSLKVVTTNMTGGFLLSSRNTYSERAVLTEHFTHHRDFGVEYFTVTAIIDDGGASRITSSTFKKETDGSKFAPKGCEIAR